MPTKNKWGYIQLEKANIPNGKVYEKRVSNYKSFKLYDSKGIGKFFLLL